MKEFIRSNSAALIIAAGIVLGVIVHACATRYDHIGFRDEQTGEYQIKAFDRWTGETVRGW